MLELYGGKFGIMENEIPSIDEHFGGIGEMQWERFVGDLDGSVPSHFFAGYFFGTHGQMLFEGRGGQDSAGKLSTRDTRADNTAAFIGNTSPCSD